ncbi:MAG: DUF4349 domain-containing protein [Myxococcales bacterium]|nr:DUF4349 domain-containing protein [Myxococcales bacterium]MCB9533774.1 DUF4349 domain-containing protein [Myxococcales bacterium]
MIRTTVLCLIATAVAACGGTQASYDAYDPYRLDSGATVGGYASEESWGDVAQVAVETASRAPRSSRNESRGSGGGYGGAPAAPMPMPTGPGVAPAQTMVADARQNAVPPEEPDRAAPLLIYTGNVTIAIYDVEETQARAIAAVEELGGYASQRGDTYVVLRVPAEHFREALDAVGELGDVLSLSWDASDVTDAYFDLEIRIRNARDVRDRLAALLDEAVKVDDALAIESELARVTLELEQLEGQLRQMRDRVALATLTVSFSAMAQTRVPGEEYRLPFRWLNELGVERLLSL